MKEFITYNLNNGEKNSNNYYNDISLFTDDVLFTGKEYLSEPVKKYAAYVKENKIEELRTNEEYFFELLSLGILWRVYGENSLTTHKIVVLLLAGLFYIRQTVKALKPPVDKIRGIAATLFLSDAKKQKFIKKPSLKKIERLILWLKATGEFKEEVKRFTKWLSYFRSLNAAEFVNLTNNISAFAEWFEIYSKARLGSYTPNVETYLNRYLTEHKWQEDIIFCGRKEVEYFMNMTGAEIMNRAFRTQFLNTDKFTVLLPACMRYYGNGKCKAKKNSMDLICTDCTNECKVHQYKMMGEKYNYDVRVIPHSSDFTNWLKTWAEGKNIGVVGVACLLNLIQGGYELRGLSIPSQCVLLDYCGCENHWSEERVRTDLNSKILLSCVCN